MKLGLDSIQGVYGCEERIFLLRLIVWIRENVSGLLGDRNLRKICLLMSAGERVLSLFKESLHQFQGCRSILGVYLQAILNYLLKITRVVDL